MYTINLEQLKASPSWRFLSDDLKSAVTEYLPELPILSVKNAQLPAHTLNVEKQTITLQSPINIADINQIYNSTLSKWIFLGGIGYERYQKITMSGDGLVITCPAGSIASTTDKISSAINANFKVTDSLPRLVAPAVEWLTPILILDPTQINDKTTYDGGFAVYENEVKSLYAPTATGACLWMYITDFNRLFAKEAQAAPTRDKSKILSKIDDLARQADELKIQVLGW